MTEVEITSDVEAKFAELAKDMDPVSAKAALKAANYAGGKIAEEVYSRMGGSGQLARSFLPARFVESDRGVSAGALSTLVYAGIQDKGGRIDAKAGKMLSVPLTPAAKKRWPRDWSNLVLIKSKKANQALLAERLGKGKSARLKFHYVLKKHVNISPKGYIAAALEASEDGITSIVDETIGERTANA